MYVVAQFFGLMAITLWILSVQNKKQVKILEVQLLSNVFFCLQYLFLNAYTAAVLYVVAIFRSYIFYINRKKYNHISIWWLIFFLVLVVVSFLVTYEDWYSILPTLVIGLCTVATYLENPKYIRGLFLIIPIFETWYNLIIGAYISIIGSVFEFFSGIVSMLRYSNKKSKLS